MKVETNVKAGVCSNMIRNWADIWAGPLWNDSEARQKCPDVCRKVGGKSNGQWKTPKETCGRNSVCGCDFPKTC
jgi:hypothetical protein